MKYASIFLAILVLSACGGQDGSDTSATGTSGALSQTEFEKGIGPIKDVSLEAIDEQLVASGAEIFKIKCSACHKLDTRYVGPPLGDVLDRREPEFVMNMILNPEEMLAKHPEVRAMLGEYMTPMPNQQLTHDEARAIVEYLRTR